MTSTAIAAGSSIAVPARITRSLVAAVMSPRLGVFAQRDELRGGVGANRSGQTPWAIGRGVDRFGVTSPEFFAPAQG